MSRSEETMARIICHTGLLAADEITAVDAAALNNESVAAAPVLTTIEQVVLRLRTEERVSFRFEDFERQYVLWHRVGPAAAIVQERRDGKLRRLHLLSRGPTGEIWWEKRVAAADDGEAGLLGFLVIVPAFTEWSDRNTVFSGADC
jgi:hypothetical protein